MVSQADGKNHQALESFDAYVGGLIREWNIPGAAVAVVKGGEVVFSQGFGFRNVASELLVTPETLFAIGSTTKAFGATTVGILVDEGKLEWDAPVHQYMPELRLLDPVANANLTVRDMLCHRSGLPRHDLAWYRRKLTRKEMVQMLAHLEPSQGFRSAWQYQNLMYAAVGYLVEVVTGKTWEEFARERILEPLGMTATIFSLEQMQKSANFSLPYFEEGGEIRRIPNINLDAAGPAGNISSNLADMARWLVFNLNKGWVGQTQVISEASFRTIHHPQMLMPVDPDNPFAETDSPQMYGMGWCLFQYRGVPLAWHGGGLDGFSTQVALCPRQNLGVVAFTNVVSSVPEMLSRTILDRLLNLEPLDWNDKYKKLEEEGKVAQQQARQQVLAARKPGTQPTHPLADFAGKYHHRAYGTYDIRLEDGGLVTTFGDIPMQLMHFHYNIFEGVYPPLDITLDFSFEIDKKGAIQRLVVPFNGDEKPVVFTRVKD